MKKSFISTVAFLFLLSMLIGCSRGSYTAVSANETNSGDTFAMTFQTFNGYKERVINIKEPTEITIQASVASGTLDISVKDNNNNSYFDKENDMNETVTLNEPGKYIIHVGASDCTGSYNITWKQQ